jgi:hypothetical protein
MEAIVRFVAVLEHSMKPRTWSTSIACLLAANAMATDAWQHAAVCRSVVEQRVRPEAAATPNETALQWLGRNGWELAAIEPGACRSPRSRPGNEILEPRYWFKQRSEATKPRGTLSLPFAHLLP